MRKILAVVLVLLFTATGNASLEERLRPILPDDLSIAVDTFIVGTHDRYIATIVRDFDHEVFHELSISMRDMITSLDSDELVIIERRVFDKNSRKFSLAERSFAFSSDLRMVVAVESFDASILTEAVPGSIDELIWYEVAGPTGLGIEILGGYPEPLELTVYKHPVDTERYIGVLQGQVGGLFIDRNSIKITEEGISALIVQGFNFDEEFQFGGMAMQYTHQPYVDALYAITETEFSFERRAFRQLRFTVFGPEDQVIYAVRIMTPEWHDENMNPLAPFLLFALASNLPEDITKLMSDDIRLYTEYMRERIEAAQREYQEFHGTEPN